jgi:exopolyphosphatase
MVQTPRSDLSLRAENTYALSISGFDASQHELLCIDDLSHFPTFPSNKFALVDHNRLGSRFNAKGDAKVVAIIDHHEDEGLHKDTADPRIIVVPTGSCASLITALIEKQCPEDIQIPTQLATLLLSSIIIDTGGLKPGGKAEETDIQAARYLLPRSTLASSLPKSVLPNLDPELRLHEMPAILELTRTLQTKKSSVSHLGTRDLLRRDYKEYSLTPSWDRSSSIQLGLASVPTGIEPWVSRDQQFWTSVKEWMAERNLAVCGILTSFREEKTDSSVTKEKGKHKRELFMAVNAGAAKGGLAARLWSGVEGSEELKCKIMKKLCEKAGRHFGSAVEAKAYKQNNVNATRKVIAPLLKSIIEGSSSS